MDTHYHLVVCGGTFDLLHAGHKAFLQFILSRSDRVVLGLTTDQYTSEQTGAGTLEPYEIRKKQLEAYLKTLQAMDRVEIAPIDSVYIPEVWREYPIEAVVVTEDSRKGAALINEKRLHSSQQPLPILIHPLLQAEDSKPIASSRIRAGEIDREGKLNLRPEWFAKTLSLPDEKRDRFKNLLGDLVTDQSILSSLDGRYVATVGDVTAKTLHERGIAQRIAIIDFTVEREKTFTNVQQLGFSDNETIVHVTNPPGHLSGELFRAIELLCRNLPGKPTILLIEGEEDLTILPLVLRLPLAFQVFYGQPGVGMVRVEVTEAKKTEIASLMQLFTPQE